MGNNIENLLKTDDAPASQPVVTTSERSKKFITSKRRINGICKALCIETKTYSPQKSVESIEHYLALKEKIDRILYSEISNFVYSLDVTERGVFATNIEKLLLYCLEDGNAVGEDCRKIVIKIYDHFQLVLYQIENITGIFAKGIDETKINLNKEIKGIEREYISILGIFSSVVLAFVGGMAFSTSVLENIAGISIYRLILTVDLLAFVLINTVYMLIKFIFIINEKDASALKIVWVNVACVVIAILVVIAWALNLQFLPGFISQFLPWM